MKKNSNYVDTKIITFSILGVVLLATVVFGIIMYGKKVEDGVKSSQLSSEQIANLIEEDENSKDETEKVNSDYGKSIEDIENEAKENNEQKDKTNDVKKENNNENKTEKKVQEVNSSSTTKNGNNVSNALAKQVAKETIVKKELEFKKPVEGDIIQKFAKDNLVYSNTLSEWVTHLGIDIKAEKTTVVNSAEEGYVKTIKNDPRYGLTVVISHQDGFETLYANLLSSEFVKEGDKVEKGQAIGTVGNTGSFESAEEPHLHFEILKDSIQVDPEIYI